MASAQRYRKCGNGSVKRNAVCNAAVPAAVMRASRPHLVGRKRRRYNKMSVEIEKKYRLDEDQRRFVLAALDEVGAEFKGEDTEENVIYGGGVLDEKRAILRIRKTQDKTILTFKQRIQNESEVKQQIEYESEFADLDGLKKIVENLGFEPRLIYEKRRKTWRFRSVELVMDELPFGLYMEIEGSITAIKETEMLLDIEDFETEHETYPSLAAKFGQLRNGITESRFKRRMPQARTQ